MIINLDAKTRIRGTTHCWQLERGYVNKGEMRWHAEKYFVTFHAAVLEAYRHEIRTHHAEGIDQALQAAEQALAKYKTILDEFDTRRDAA